MWDSRPRLACPERSRRVEQNSTPCLWGRSALTLRQWPLGYERGFSPRRGLANLYITKALAAPPFAIFEGWVPRTTLSGTDRRYLILHASATKKQEVEAGGTHLSKTTKGGPASIQAVLWLEWGSSTAGRIPLRITGETLYSPSI